MEPESNGYTNCKWCSHERIGKKTRGLENNKTSGDNPNDSIAVISQHT